MTDIKTEQLIKNIVDQIKEAQIKLGYVKEAVRFYYPLSSLNALLDTDFMVLEELLSALQKEPGFQGTRIGTLSFAENRGRIEVSITSQGTEYVHLHVENPPFLTELIHLFQENHHCSLEEICAVFEKYDADYLCEDMAQDQDFDYALHFSDESIDPYFYCIKIEMGHTIYHRFARQDYIALLS